MSRDCKSLLIMLILAACVIAGAETAARSWLTKPSATETVDRLQSTAAIEIAKDPAVLPPIHASGAWLLAIGNSHTYGLPGLAQGDSIRFDGGDRLIQCLATELVSAGVDRDVQCALLAYPNFLPTEMLLRTAQLFEQGLIPTTAVIGLTWRNLARDTQVRHEIRQVFRDQRFSQQFVTLLENPQVHASPAVLDFVRSEQRRMASTEAAERVQSDADRFDQKLFSELSDHVILIGQSAELRAKVFRLATDWAQKRFAMRTDVGYAYDMIASDYSLNFACLETLLQLLRSRNVVVVCYLAPERSDLPPLMDPEHQNEFIERLSKLAEKLDVAVVDARNVVPNEYWGWVEDVPDRSHFTEPGHKRLADFLLQSEACQKAWKALTEAGVGQR